MTCGYGSLTIDKIVLFEVLIIVRTKREWHPLPPELLLMDYSH